MVDRPRTVVLVEGLSDQAALEALAERQGRDLPAEGVRIVPMGGSRSIRRFLDEFGPRGLNVAVAGLCDAGEERSFRRALFRLSASTADVERTGLGTNLTRDAMEAMGFFVCVADLEDELIRALGTDLVEEVIEDQGDLRSFRIFQKQPAQQGRTSEAQLRRFMGTRSGRKVHYARLLADAVDLSRVPRPLDRLLAHV